MSENKNAKTPADGPEYERGFVDGMQRQMQLHVNRVISEEPAKVFGPNLDIIRMARMAGLPYIYQTGEVANLGLVERFAALVAAAERNKLAAWMMRQGYATGHGDSTEDLLKELEWQIAERIRNECEECAKVCDVLAVHPEYASDITKVAAQAIRARGE